MTRIVPVRLKWNRGLVHDLVEMYTPGRTHDGTIHVWVHHSVVGNSCAGKLFMDGSLMCKHGAQGGQTGWAVGPCYKPSSCLSQERRSSQTVQLYYGVWSVVKSGAHRDEDRMHLSKSEQAKLDDAGHIIAAGNERADELAKGGARGDSFLSILYDTYKAAVETSTAIISSSFERMEKNDDEMLSHHLKDGTRRTSDGKARRRFWRVPHTLMRSGKQWRCEACGKHKGYGASKAKLARTAC